MAADIAREIIGISNRLHAAELQGRTMVIRIAHEYPDEMTDEIHTSTVDVRFFTNALGDSFIKFKDNVFSYKLPHCKNKRNRHDLLNDVVQQVLQDFLGKKNTGFFEADMDVILFSLFDIRGTKLFESRYNFPNNLNLHEVQDEFGFMYNYRFEIIKTMLKRYVQYASSRL